jgi:hypothetical protein
MKQRFVLALLTVAIAVIGSTASAIAPVISPEIPDVVISDDVTGTVSNNIFVYPDAFRLSDWVNDPDDTVTPDQVIWSYYTTGNIRINNAVILDLGDNSQNPNNPATNQRLTSAGLNGTPDDPAQQDNDTVTITLRNVAYSPIGGPYSDPDGLNQYTTDTFQSTPTLLGAAEPVTLLASDGTTFSERSILVYTENNGTDRLSGVKFNVVDTVPSQSSLTDPWFGYVFDFSNTGTTAFDSHNGLCITVPAAGSNFALWHSTYGGSLQLLQNTVYRFRLDVESNTGDLPKGTTPFWDLVIDNVDEATSTTIQSSQSKFTGDFMNWDNNGSANSLRSDVGRNQFDVYWAPAALDDANWNDPVTGEFIPDNDAYNDMKLSFRVIDVTGPIDGQNDLGTLCLRHLTVDRANEHLFQVVNPDVWTENNVTLDNFSFTSIFNNSTIFDFTTSAGNAIISPWLNGPRGGNAWSIEVIQVVPGDANVDFSTTDTINATVPDNWPIPWVSDQLLKGTISMQAPNAASEVAPPDALSVGFDSATSELLYSSAMLSGSNNVGMPKNGVASNYVAYFYTHNASLATPPALNALRLTLSILNNPNVLGGGVAANAGGVRVNSFNVQQLRLPDEF